MKKFSGIYCILNLSNGKKYIGLSRNIHRRWLEHRSELNRNEHINPHLQSAWNYYGEDNFEFFILELCDKRSLAEREKYYIKEYHTLSREDGYNLTPGGENVSVGKVVINFKDDMIFETIQDAADYAGVGHKTMVNWCKDKRDYAFLNEYNSLSNEQKEYYLNFDWKSYDHERLSKAHSAENLSFETLAKYKIATTGSNNPRAFKVYCPQLDETFDCAKYATDKYGINRGSISLCLSGKLQSAGLHPVTKEKLTWIKV